MVTFSSTIYPIDAKGMVEKWLLQVGLLYTFILETELSPTCLVTRLESLAWSQQSF